MSLRVNTALPKNDIILFQKYLPFYQTIIVIGYKICTAKMLSKVAGVLVMTNHHTSSYTVPPEIV